MIGLLLGGAVFTADREIKDALEETLKPGDERVITPDMKILLHHNYGFAANLGAGEGSVVKNCSVFFTAAVCVAFFTAVFKKGTVPLRAGLGLMMGGALSNTCDRLKKGYVTDYLNIPKGPGMIKRLIWNISDFAIITGALITLIEQGRLDD